MARKSKDLTPKDPDYITSLERGIRILQVFDRENPELMLGEVAQRANLSPATARRFLLTLKTLGFIGKSGRHYLLRSKVLDLGYAYINSMSVDRALQPFLLELAQRTGECASVAVFEGTEAVFIANYSHGRNPRLSAVAGSRFPAYVIAAGRVLLAHRTPAQLQDYFKTAHLRKITESTETNVDRLAKSLEGVRASGYALIPDELELGLVTVAVPIIGSSGNVIASITCASITRRTYDEEFIQILREYAKKMSGALERFPSFEHSVLSADIHDSADTHDDVPEESNDDDAADADAQPEHLAD